MSKSCRFSLQLVLIINRDFGFRQVQRDLLCNHFYNKNVYY